MTSYSSPLEVTSSRRVTPCVFFVSLLLVSRVCAVQPISLHEKKLAHTKNFVSQYELSDRSNEVKAFNVVSYGAKGDGKNPDTKAFFRAWQAACNTEGSVTVIVPEGKTFLLGPAEFDGPCKAASIDLQVDGEIVAPGSVFAWKGRDRRFWLGFIEVTKLTIRGGGTLDGNGAVWWKCREQETCSGLAPVALYVGKGKDVSISNLKFVNSQGVHVKVAYSKNVQISNLHLNAPDDSPNTDGINVATCDNVQISSSNIETGDDCISITGDTREIDITDIMCGPGHGISIGSLGKNGATDGVQDVHVKNAHFFRTDNGVRIKTWQGGRGIVKNVSFEQLSFTEARNPISIGQFYCPNGDGNCPDKAGAVKIEDVRIIDANGTTFGDIAINLKCKSHMCSGIYLRDIDLRSSDPAMKAISFCSGSDGISEANVQPPVPCLQSRPPSKRHPQNVKYGLGKRSSSISSSSQL